ncbi:multidrug effflux MFS transporter [Rhodanobacter aciditrophus]|uniref:Bcr/CflA family efflux transporter n=1 Tax=Rhodanobacter aciditrophus TaxID=1623218 RepID=A0ABW4B5L4_9GAMM
MNKYHGFLIILLGLLAGLGPLCTDLYLPALPNITSELGSTTATSQFTLTTALFGLGIGQLVFGPLSDKFGRKIPLLMSLLLFVGASIWCALATDMQQLIIARFIQGLAGSGGAVLSRAIARDLYSGADLTRFFALLMAVNGLAPIAAPIIGGFQLEYTPWQGLFISLAVIAGGLALVSTVGLKETLKPEHISQQSMAKGIKEVLSNRSFIGMSLAQGFVFAGMFAYIAASSYVFQEQFELSPQAYSYVFGLNGFGMIISAGIVAKLARHHGETSVINYTISLAVLSAACLFAVSLLDSPLLLVVPVLLVTIAFTSALATLINSKAMQKLHKNAGVGSAVLGATMFAFGGVSSPLTGINGTSLISMSIVVLTCYALGALSWFFIAKINKPYVNTDGIPAK